jgi:hypothetical protein
MADPLAEGRTGNMACLFESLLAAVAGATVALVFGLTAGLSGEEYAPITIVAGLLAGGLAFSLLELRRRAHRNPERDSKRIAELEAFEIELAAQRERAEEAMTEVAGPEPYRHHEDHAESPGYDQGQLTSRLAGTTPFLKRLDREHHR